jgi:hypothetical protein
LINQTVPVGWGNIPKPSIIYSPHGGSGGGLIFLNNTQNGLYFNAPWFAGVAEQPAPGRSASALKVTPSVSAGPVRLSWAGNATRLTVTDVAGRIVRDFAAPAGGSLVWDGKVAAGTYFVHLVTNQGSATRPVVIR